jgi:hypothetical protein
METGDMDEEVNVMKEVNSVKNTTFVDEISGSHRSEYQDDCLLGCCAV